MLGLLLSLTLAANAKTIKISKTTSSSFFSEKSEVYKVQNLKSGQVAKPWVEGDKGSGLGAWVEFSFGSEELVEEIHLWNGNWYSAKYWRLYNRASKIEVIYSDGSKESFTLSDKKKKEILKLKKPVKTSSVKLIIRGVHSGDAYTDRTALSEIQFVNGEDDNFHRPVASSASSVAKEDGDGDYEPTNLFDRISDTAWCEKGSGLGEWVAFDFGKKQKVSGLQLINGFAAGPKVFFAFGRAKKAKLHFDDGSTHDISIKPMFKSQTITFPETSSRKVKLELTEVAPGKKIQRVCLSEVRFK